MSFSDCLGLVVLRGRLMDRTAGGMVVVHATADALAPLLAASATHAELDLAAIHAPELCVASGATSDLSAFEDRLDAAGIEHQRVKIHIAAHSRLLDPVLDEFRGADLRGIWLSSPSIRWVSNRTGTWITDAEATDPDYWVRPAAPHGPFHGGHRHDLRRPRCHVRRGGPRPWSRLARTVGRSVRCASRRVVMLRHPDERVHF